MAFLPPKGTPSETELATNVAVKSDSTITATVPAGWPFMKSGDGKVEVRVVVGSDSSNGVAFTYTLHLDSLTPDTSGPNGGETMTIRGSGFGAPGSTDSVSFLPGKGGATTAAGVKVISNKELTCIIPLETKGTATAGGKVRVAVVVDSIDSNEARFRYDLHLDAITPRGSGPNGGITVTLTGGGFGPKGSDDRVSFLPPKGKATDAADAKVVSDTTMTAVVPAESFKTADEGGHVQVAVIAASIPSNDVKFSYELHIDSISPNSSDPNGGGRITIRGRGFIGHGDVVLFLPPKGAGKDAGGVRVLSDSEIRANIPKETQAVKAGGGHVTVYVYAADIASNGMRFSYHHG